VALPAEFHPEAQAEFDAAADRYQRERHGLGAEFVAAVEAAVGRAAGTPLAGAPLAADVRRVFMRRFPYAVLYAPESNRLLVLAVAHLRRRPGYWRHRR
jgi:toxin ParE1/3/4